MKLQAHCVQVPQRSIRGPCEVHQSRHQGRLKMTITSAWEFKDMVAEAVGCDGRLVFNLGHGSLLDTLTSLPPPPPGI